MNFINLRHLKNLIILFEYKGCVEAALFRRHWYKWIPVEFKLYEEVSIEITRGLDKRNTAILWLLSRDKYQMHQVSYPKGVKEDLPKIIRYDLEEIFPAGEETFFILGEPMEIEDKIFLPVFYQTKLQFQNMAKSFEGFSQITVTPLAFFYADLVEEPTCLVLLPLGNDYVEASVFINKVLRDVFLIEKDNVAYARSYLETLGIKKVFYLGSPVKEEFLKEFNPKEINLEEEVLKTILPYIVSRVEIPGWPGTLRLQISKVVLGYIIMIFVLSFYLLYPFYLRIEKKHLTNRLVAVSQEVTKLQKKWQPIAKIEQEIQTFKTLHVKLSSIEKEVISPLQVLKTLTEVTPDDTWISYFELREKTIIIKGESDSVVKYMEKLAHVETFANVKLVSPVRKNPRTQQERFHIRIELK